MTPLTAASTSVSTFSVSITYSGWPSVTTAPSSTSHSTRLASTMAIESLGTRTGTGSATVPPDRPADGVDQHRRRGQRRRLEPGGRRDRGEPAADAGDRRRQLPEQLGRD